MITQRMHHRTMSTQPLLSPAELAFLVANRTAVLATIDDGGVPRLVPICFVVTASPRLVLHSPLDEKPKRVADPHDLERVRDILERPEIALLIDAGRVEPARLASVARTRRPGRTGYAAARTSICAVAACVGYPQYETHRPRSDP
jgi:hypothetical protein